MIGIYSITNKINGKKYIGKSSNIIKRFRSHRSSLKNYCICQESNRRRVNRHLGNAVIKYGIDNFEFEILEVFDVLAEAELADAEIKWIDFYATTDRDNGYNLMKDSSTATVVNEETRKIISEATKGCLNPNYGNNWSDKMKKSMSEIKKAQYQDGTYDHMKTNEWRKKLSDWSSSTWEDEDKKLQMARKVAEVTSTLKFEQYDKVTGELVGTYGSMLEIIDKYPDYHKKAIYSVCNGWKKSYRGHIWKSVKK